MTSPTLWSRLVPVIAAVLLAAACSSPPPDVPVGADGQPDEVLAIGRDVYGARCANCHGSSGGGGTGPRLAGQVAEEYPDPADQAAVIRDGRGSMPSFLGRLSEAEIDAVVRYTREVLE